MSDQNIFNAISKMAAAAPRKQRQLCDYILHNCPSVYMLTAAELAEKAGVGTATVMRLAAQLGCDGFSDLKRRLSEAYLEKFTAEEFRESFRVEPQADGLAGIRAELSSSLQNALEQLEQPQVARVADMLLNSRSVQVLGLRSSRAVALYLCYQLEALLGQVRDLGENSELVYDRLLRCSEQDLVLMVCNTPTSRSALDYAAFCKERGIPLVLITDSGENPLAAYAAAVLTAPKTAGARYSLLPIIGVLEILLNEVGVRTSPISTRYINKRNQFFKDHDVCIW